MVAKKNEWEYKPKDFSKEKKCLDCRYPPVEYRKRAVEDRIYTCRDCARCEIKVCEDCGKEMGYCTIFNDPPNKVSLVKRHKCIRFIKIKNG